VGAESFTVLAILEARDAASEIFAKVDESLEKFAGTAESAADAAQAAGAAIDESLLQTASGADALDLASARVAGAQAAAGQAAQQQAAWEKELINAQAAAADGANADALAQDRLVEAEQRLTAATKENAVAQKNLASAQKLQSDTATAAAAKTDVAAESTTKAGDAAGDSAVGLSALSRTAGIVALGMGIAGAVMVKAAGDFQDSTTHLVTDAGESAKNLSMVQAGILQVSTATGTSAADITDAMYHIESGGMHGAAGLQLLKVAAEGAKVGGADLDTVSKTLVGTLNAYGIAASGGASMMNQLIATVGAGDMRMQDLASSLSAVTPLAAAAGISFSQVGGAIATMTSQGMSAQQATQDLANTIRSLSNPNSVAVNEMAQLGLSSNQVASSLGKKGLTGTIAELTQAITSKMGPAGQVILNAFNQSKAAGADATTMFGNLGGAAQNLAKQYESGSIGIKAYKASAQALGGVQGNLAMEFLSTYDKSKSFNSLLTSGAPGVQTYTAALAKMMGGSTGLNTALMLSGNHLATFEKNTETVAAAAKKGGENVSNWATIQSTFNFKMESAKTAIENTGIAIGTALLPAATTLLKAITSILEPLAEWTAKHKTLTEILFGGVLALATLVVGLALAAKAFSLVGQSIEGVTKTLRFLGIISEATAATEDEAAATTAAAWIAANAAMLLGVGAVILAIAAIVVIVVELVKHWGAVEAAAKACWSAVVDAAKDVWNWIKSNWPLLLGILLGPFGAILGVIIKFHKQITDVIGGIIRWIEGEWDQLVGIFSAPFKALAGVVSKAFDQVKNVIVTGFDGWWKSHGDEVKEIWAAIWNGLKDVFLPIWNGIVAVATAVWTALSDVFQASLNMITGIWTAVWDGITAVIGAVWDGIVDVIRGGVDVVVDVWNAAWSAVAGAVAAWWKTITAIIHGAVLIVEGIFRAVWDVIGGIVKAGWDVIVGIFTVALDLIESVLKVAWDLLVGVIDVALDLITGNVGKAWDDIQNTVTQVWNAISGFFKSAWATITGVFTAATGAISGGLTAAWGTITSTVSYAWDRITLVISTAVDKVKAVLAWFEGLPGMFLRWLDGAYNSVVKGGAQVLSWFSGLRSKVAGFVSAIPGDMVTLGVNIVKGIWSGLESMGSWLYSQVESWISSVIPGPIKKILGIASPSKWGAWAGQMTGQGLINGMVSTYSGVASAATGMARAVTGTALGTLSSGTGLTVPSLSGAAGAGAGGTSITLDLRGSQVMSDRDMDLLVNKVGRAVATRILPQSGVRVRFG
jgi:TP901 family phage tail tape measure protein